MFVPDRDADELGLCPELSLSIQRLFSGEMPSHVFTISQLIQRDVS